MQLACLGPAGSFSHLLAQQLDASSIVALPTIHEVFEYVAQHSNASGLVPIENSSGGFITDTIDCLLFNKSPMHVTEQITLHIHLALLGKCKHQQVKTIYSHAMPFYHCRDWIKQHYAAAECIACASTAAAAQIVAQSNDDEGKCALASLSIAAEYNLHALHKDVAADVPNTTQFYLINKSINSFNPHHQRTAIAIDIPDEPGSLHRFLEPLSNNNVNLKRLNARPAKTKMGNYRFFVEIQGVLQQQDIYDIIDASAASVRIIGYYNSHREFQS